MMCRKTFSKYRTSAECIALGILLVYVVLIANLAARQAPTYDEPGHLVAGVSNWTKGRFEVYRVNPPLTRLVAALPVLVTGCNTDWSRFSEGPGQRPELDLGAAFVAANGERSVTLFTFARWACIAFSVFGAVVCVLWSWSIWRSGKIAVVCLLCWCSDPNLLSHGSLITPDSATAAMGLFAAATFWQWLRRPSWTWATIAGVGLGLAQLAKMTWLMLFGLWPAFWIVHVLSCIWSPTQESQASAVAGRIGKLTVQFSQLSGILLLALWVLNLGYGFSQFGKPLGKFQFVSRVLSGEVNGVTGNRFAGTLAENVPVPLPAQYVLGFDIQKKAFETAPELSYLNGRWREGGWWYYYIYGWLVKTPHATQLLLFGAFVVTIISLGRFDSRIRSLSADQRLALLIIAGVSTALLILVSSQTNFNRHFRYVLPIVAFQPIVIGALIFLTSRMRRAGAAIGACVFLGASSMAMTYPCGLTYFNELSGGPAFGFRHLNNSNYDWGQDLIHLVKWSRESGDHQPLHVSCMASFDVTQIGLSCVYLDINSSSNAHRDLEVSRTTTWPEGWYAFSANHALTIEELPLIDLVVGGPGSSFRTEEQQVVFHQRLGNSIWLFSINRNPKKGGFMNHAIDAPKMVIRGPPAGSPDR